MRSKADVAGEVDLLLDVTVLPGRVGPARDRGVLLGRLQVLPYVHLDARHVPELVPSVLRDWRDVHRVSPRLLLPRVLLDYFLRVETYLPRLKILHLQLSRLSLRRKSEPRDSSIMQVRVIQFSVELVVEVLGRVLPLFCVKFRLLPRILGFPCC